MVENDTSIAFPSEKNIQTINKNPEKKNQPHKASNFKSTALVGINQGPSSGIRKPLLEARDLGNAKQKRKTVDEKGRQIYSSGKIGFEDESFFSKIFFLHLNKIVDRGSKTPYKFEMLYELDDQLLYADFEEFNAFFSKNIEKYKKDVLGAIFAYNRKYFALAHVAFFFRYVGECSFPLLIKQILNWFELQAAGQATMFDGYYYAAMITVYVFVRSYCGLFADYIYDTINARVRNLFRVSMCRKV